MNHIKLFMLLLICLVFMFISTNCTISREHDAITSATGRWLALFDGRSLDNWEQQKPGGWVIEDGALTPTSEGGYIFSKERFGDFVLEVEFKMSPECNSGVFFRLSDKSDPVQTGIEMQVLDSAGKTALDKHDCGALYDLLEPQVNAAKKPGEWNRATIECRGSSINITLNGKRVIAADLNRWTQPNLNPDGTPNKFNTALKDFSREGHIALQYHGAPVWYRNIRVQKL